jgi:O-antigen ligase
LRASLERFLPVLCLFLYAAAATLGAFTGGLWAALGIGGAALLFIGVGIADKIMPFPPKNLALFVLAALWVFGAELPVSSHVEISLKMWERLASVFLPLLLLTSPRLQTVAFSRSFVPAVALAMGLGAGALGLELLSGGFLLHTLKNPNASLNEYNRGMAHVIILAFPLLAGLWLSGRKKAAALLVLALLFPAGLTESRTAKLALIAGIACTAAAFYRPVLTRSVLAVASIGLAGFPFYAQRLFLAAPEVIARLPDSWRQRMEIWDFLSYRIAERPVFGWGLGTTHTLDFTQPHGEMYRFAVGAAPHAHNFIVELWAETGVFGAVLGVAFLLFILRRVGRIHESLRPFALGGFTAAVTVSLFGFDFWTDALWAAFALSACAFGMLQQHIERGKNLACA